MGSKASPATAGPGDVLGGRYEVKRILGRGGFGVVFLVRALHDGAFYALKVSLRGGGASRSEADRFHREADVWIALGAHPNLVQAHFVDLVADNLVIGMEYVPVEPDGKADLASYLREGAVGLEQAVVWLVQLCHAMEYAAHQGLRSHRDLKPPNVMIGRQREVKVTDFGLATRLGGTEAENLGEIAFTKEIFKGDTMRGLGFGTPSYMPPEQFVDAAAADARTDIYAVGVMAHQMIHGKLPVSLPWPGQQSREAHLRYWRDMEAAHRAFAYRGDGNPLDPVIARCLDTDPVARYASFEELRHDLTHLARKAGIRVPAPPAVPEPSASDLVNRGLSFQRLGRLDDAVTAFRSALSRDANLAEAHNGLGVSLALLSRHDEAIKAFERAVEIEPEHARILSNRASSLRAVGRTEDALRDLDAALKVDPSNAGGWTNRGNLLSMLGDTRGALRNYQRALGLEPGRSAARLNRARLLISQGLIDEAMADVEEVLESDSTNHVALDMLGTCLLRRFRFHEAAGVFGQLRDTEGGMSPRSWLGHGLASLYSGDHTTAQHALDRAGESESVRGDALMGHALQAVMDRRFLTALNLVGEAVACRASMNHRSLHSLCLHLTGQYLEAASQARSHLRDGSDDVLGTNTAVSLLRAGKFEKALECMEKYVSSRTPTVSYNLGLALAEMGRHDAAKSCFVESAEDGALESDAWYNRGVCDLRAGMVPDALAAFEKAHRLTRTHAGFWKSGTRHAHASFRIRDSALSAEPAMRLRQIRLRSSRLHGDGMLRSARLLVPIVFPT